MASGRVHCDQLTQKWRAQAWCTDGSVPYAGTTQKWADGAHSPTQDGSEGQQWREILPTGRSSSKAPSCSFCPKGNMARDIMNSSYHCGGQRFGKNIWEMVTGKPWEAACGKTSWTDTECASIWATWEAYPRATSSEKNWRTRLMTGLPLSPATRGLGPGALEQHGWGNQSKVRVATRTPVHEGWCDYGDRPDCQPQRPTLCPQHCTPPPGIADAPQQCAACTSNTSPPLEYTGTLSKGLFSLPTVLLPKSPPWNCKTPLSSTDTPHNIASDQGTHSKLCVAIHSCSWHLLVWPCSLLLKQQA